MLRRALATAVPRVTTNAEMRYRGRQIVEKWHFSHHKRTNYFSRAQTKRASYPQQKQKCAPPKSINTPNRTIKRLKILLFIPQPPQSNINKPKFNQLTPICVLACHLLMGFRNPSDSLEVRYSP